MVSFLERAKQAAKDAEELAMKLKNQTINAVEEATGSGQHESVKEAPSSSSAPSTVGADTPTSSVAPSVAPTAKKSTAPKLPLAARKNVRDNFENHIEELNKKWSDTLGVSWTIDVDVPEVYQYGDADSYAKRVPGDMIFKYFDEGARMVAYWLQKAGQDGKDELNRVANLHQVTMLKDDTGKHNYCGCDIKGGQLRILFNEKMLGTNIDRATSEIGKAVQEAEQPGGTSGGEANFTFDTRYSIKNDYTAKVGPVQAKLRELLAMPSLEFDPNFAHNVAELTKMGNDAPRDWQKRIGAQTLTYFEGFIFQMEYQGFGKDDMLQEGFQEAVDKGVIQLRIVDKLEKRTYNETVVVDGIAYMQTVPKYWSSNINDAGIDFVKLL